MCTGAVCRAFDVEGTQASVAVVERHGLTGLSPQVVVARTGGPNAGAPVVSLRAGDGVTIEFIERPHP